MANKTEPEHLLSEPITLWLRVRGYEVYAEIPWLGRTVDLVGITKTKHIAVELKKNVSYKLLIQCLPLQIATPYVYGAVARRPTAQALATFKHYGLGLLLVSDAKVETLLEPASQCCTDSKFALDLTDCEPGGLAGLRTGSPRRVGVKRQPRTNDSTWFGIFQRLKFYYDGINRQ